MDYAHGRHYTIPVIQYTSHTTRLPPQCPRQHAIQQLMFCVDFELRRARTVREQVDCQISTNDWH